MIEDKSINLNESEKEIIDQVSRNTDRNISIIGLAVVVIAVLAYMFVLKKTK